MVTATAFWTLQPRRSTLERRGRGSGLALELRVRRPLGPPAEDDQRDEKAHRDTEDADMTGMPEARKPRPTSTATTTRKHAEADDADRCLRSRFLVIL